MKYTFLAIWKNLAHALQLSYVIHLIGDKVVERINHTFLVRWKNVACILQLQYGLCICMWHFQVEQVKP